MMDSLMRGRFFAALSIMALTILGIAAPDSAEAGRRRWSGSSLSISGTPATSVVAGSPYSFSPTTKSYSTTLSYSISNKPAWASFSIAKGTLSGTPASTQVGGYTNVTISVSNGTSIATLAPFSITVTAPTTSATITTNTPPVISGAPSTSVLAGNSYSFRPTATDANGDALNFSISGKPAWANFDATTGLLVGTPDASYVGSYANIVISVSDGKASTSLAAFTITVNSIALGSASLAWTPPTQNADGSSLTNLAGYTIFYGTNSTSLTSKVVIANPGTSTYTLGNLSSGIYYFGITAYTTGGAESGLSNIGTKTIL
jgi:hypothetical protein